MANATAPKLTNERKEKDKAKAQADQVLIDARVLADKYRISYNDLDTAEDLKKKVAKAIEDGVIPDGESAPEVSNRTLGKLREESKQTKTEDREISSEKELAELQESKKLIGFGGWTIEKKVNGEVKRVPAKGDDGSYGFIPGAKGIVRVALMLLLAFGVCLAGEVKAIADTDGTKGDILTLLYVDDTVGWIIKANSGVTITQTVFSTPGQP